MEPFYRNTTDYEIFMFNLLPPAHLLKLHLSPKLGTLPPIRLHRIINVTIIQNQDVCQLRHHHSHLPRRQWTDITIPNWLSNPRSMRSAPCNTDVLCNVCRKRVCSVRVLSTMYRRSGPNLWLSMQTYQRCNQRGFL